MTALLEARGVVRRFGGVVALDGLDLVVQPNEIVGLIGPNGSGKTTFFNIVTGIYGANALTAPTLRMHLRVRCIAPASPARSNARAYRCHYRFSITS